MTAKASGSALGISPLPVLAHIARELAPILWRLVLAYGGSIAVGHFLDSWLLGLTAFVAVAATFPIPETPCKNSA